MAVAVLCLAAGVFAACGSSDSSTTDSSNGDTAAASTSASTSTTASTTQSLEGTKFGMALTGPRNDDGYNQGYYDGLTAAEKKYGVKGSVVDNASTPELVVNALQSLAADNKVVIGVGAEFAEAGLTVAPKFPDTTFIIVNGEMSKDAPNAYAYFVRQGIPGYPGGVIAGHLTKTKKIGFIGGMQLPPTLSSEAAFEAGAQSVDPAIKQVSAIVGSYTDANKAKEAARAQIASGADVIYAFQNGTAVTAVAQAIKESGKDVKMMTPINPRCDEFPKVDYGTAYLSTVEQVLSIVGDYGSDNLPSEPKSFGLEDPSIQRFELCPDFDTPEFRKIVKETTDGINDGSITPPKGV